MPAATLLLNAAADGDARAAAELLPMVYDQLRRAAQVKMASEWPGHRLDATPLVHEAYLKLVGPREVPWAGRAPGTSRRRRELSREGQGA